MENSKSIRSNTGYRNIVWSKTHSKFIARLEHKHRTINLHIGLYDTLKEAVKAREDFIKSLF